MLNGQPLNASDVASLLHIGKNAVYELAKQGSLPSYKIGRKILFSMDDIETYLASTHTATNPKLGINASNDEEGFRIGGVGLPVDLIVERLIGSGVDATHKHMTSYCALYGLYKKHCDAAIIHLYDQRTNSYNIPYVQRLAPGVPIVVFRLAKRWQGFVVAKGNPKSISTWGAILRPDIRLANRIRGCGSRILLDEKLLAMEADPASINGYDSEYGSELTAIQAVSSGIADVTVVGEQAVMHLDEVDFIPMQQEWVDFAVAKGKKNRELVKQTKRILSDSAFKSEYTHIMRGDTSNLGAIVYEC